MKRKLPLDLICIDGREKMEDLNASLAALEFSCKEIEFATVQLLSPRVPKLSDGITWHCIQRLPSSEIYSKFVLDNLSKYMTQTHCLLVQWDGFVVNPEFWREQFLDYDYVGAPWPIEWSQAKTNRVGNGGFSIRSKKLADRMIGEYEPSFHIPEDNFICLTNKKILTLEGFKFAPADIAALFSWENPIPEAEPNRAFGFHGRHPENQKYHDMLADFRKTAT